MSKKQAKRTSPKALGGKGGKPTKAVPMELAVVPAEEAGKLSAALSAKVPWENVAKAMVDALTATKWVAVARSEYMEVPDHAMRVKGACEIRDTVIGRPVARIQDETVHPEIQVSASLEETAKQLADSPAAMAALQDAIEFTQQALELAQNKMRPTSPD
jgi:hypothetical protein